MTMDLSSMGRTGSSRLVAVLVILISVVSSVHSQVPDIGHSQGTGYEDYRITGDIFIFNTRHTNLGENVEAVLEQSLNKHGQVIVKLGGNAISIVKDAEALKDLLESVEPTLDQAKIANDLLDVLYVCEKKTHIYMIVDGEAAMTQEAELVLQTLKDLPIRIDVLSIAKANEGERVKRAINFYQLLANISGGSVITTNKDNIGSAVDIIKQSLQTNMVHIMKLFTSDAPGKTFMVSVDETITTVVIQIQINGSAAVPMVTMGNGLPCPNHPRLLGKTGAGSVVSLIEYNITTPSEAGMWKISKMDLPTWDLSVKAHSPVDFTHEFVEPGPGGFGEYPLKGRPIAGQTYKIVVTVPEYQRWSKLSVMFFMSRDKIFPVGFGGLTNVGGRRGKSMWYTSLKVPSEDFMIAIEGKDLSSKTARRLDPILITPTTLLLEVPAMAAVKFLQNDTLEIPFNVTNAGTTSQDVDVKIEDDKKFSRAPLILSYTIAPGSSELGKFNIQAGNIVGETSTVTITARPFILGGSFQTGQYEIRRFTVEKKPKLEDKIDPTCNITKITGDCNIGADLCSCSKKFWIMEMEIGDVGFGLRTISQSGTGANDTYKFRHDNFTQGHNNSIGAISARLESDCCHQSASVDVEDMADNRASCQANLTQGFTPPDPALCNNSTKNVTLTCSTVKTTGTCSTYGSNPCDCDKEKWHVRAEFNTTGYNFSQVYTDNAGSNTSLTRNGNNVELDVDCCHQQVAINVVDVANNFGQCNVSLSNFTLPGKCTTTVKTTTTSTAGTTTSPGATTGTGSTKGGASTSAGATTKAGSGTGGTATSGSSTGTRSGATPVAGSSSSTTTTNKPKGGKASPNPPAGGNSSGSGSSSGGDDNSSGNNRITATSIGVGMTIGAVIGVSAVVVMAVLFRKAITKSQGSIGPEEGEDIRRRQEERERLRRQSNLAWS